MQIGNRIPNRADVGPSPSGFFKDSALLKIDSTPRAKLLVTIQSAYVLLYQTGDVSCWHISDLSDQADDVRSRGDTLQKSFCIELHKFSGPYARRSNNHLRDYVICDELTGDFGNGLEATLVGDCSSFTLFAGN
jgi:hypothetical protein